MTAITERGLTIGIHTVENDKIVCEYLVYAEVR